MNPWREGQESPTVSSIFGRDQPPHQGTSRQQVPHGPHPPPTGKPSWRVLAQRYQQQWGLEANISGFIPPGPVWPNGPPPDLQPPPPRYSMPQVPCFTDLPPHFVPQTVPQFAQNQPHFAQNAPPPPFATPQFPQNQEPPFQPQMHHQPPPFHFAQAANPQMSQQAPSQFHFSQNGSNFAAPPHMHHQPPPQPEFGQYQHQPQAGQQQRLTPTARPTSRAPTVEMVTDSRAPKIQENLCYYGDAKGLQRFLVEIHDELDQIVWKDDKSKINWIARHFNSTSSNSSSTQIWFMGLLQRNAFCQGYLNPYGNLKALSYDIPKLLNLDNFSDELIYKFGDKHADKTFLHPSIQMEAARVAGWVNKTDLTRKQAMAVEAADILDLRSKVAHMHPHLKVPGEVYRHPNHHPLSKPIHHQLQHQALNSCNNNGPIPMDIVVNKLSLQQDGSNPFPAIRRICNSQRLCYDCLKVYDDKHKRLRGVHGRRSCPNPPARMEDKLKLLRSSVNLSLNSAPGQPTQISAMDLEDAEYAAYTSLPTATID
ncbi:uncharacterized protein MELLADRAFT_106566 [Melampsora larici-populina 98AG31]|uniref:Uncharacterized protein n=1 Tax=Melampsora larici-populina (strain 98AG31 / pathotype 3-4-7) TaxID=747676 RepID=F4RLX5_MELLP|nr:uncharacterized protein MELLADRAFT_106566 [Melampsora larici-populina 98AG31]EGG06620.1 hypothetical protein MELLADRAFT_106566 [Melampsora larici-populina 98AG31]